LTRPAFFDILNLHRRLARKNSFIYNRLGIAGTLQGVIVFLFANFLSALATVLGIALNLYMWIIIARALLSWVNPDPYNPVVRFLNSITEPVLYRVRRAVPMHGIGLDLSPILVILAIYFLQVFLVQSLHMAAAQLR
jgi:YggT family protein